jgi:hypothetical protein
MSVAQELFEILKAAHKMHRRDDPHTSEEAALAVAPHLNEIHKQVEAYATRCGYFGFTDYELNIHFMTTSSTYRSRRSELTDMGILVDSGKVKRKEGSARNHTIWMHRDFVGRVK